MIKVIKRDGSIVRYNRTKVKKSILLAADSVGISIDADAIVDSVTACVPASSTLAAIADCTEEKLMAVQPQVAKAFVLYRNNRDRIRSARSNGKQAAAIMADYVHKTKYAKTINGRRETYEETVDRVFTMHLKQIGSAVYAALNMDNIKQMVLDKKILPSMRSMQFAGAGIEANNARMYNCTFTLCDRPRVFAETLWLLLSGCGVGYSVQRRHVDKMPVVTSVGTVVYHYEVADTIEGWADALNCLIDSFMVSSADCYGKRVCFSYRLIRDEGSVLSTSGGLAPGHLGLERSLEAIRAVLVGSSGRAIRPIECHDIMCHAAEAVLSGGVRRSAMISIFGDDDGEMMYSKTGDWATTNGQRAFANNSVAILRSAPSGAGVLRRVLSLAATGYGEPGFVLLDDLDTGVNPCGEIGIDPVIDGQTGFGFCNLVEINAATVSPGGTDIRRRARAAGVLATVQATYNKMGYLSSVTQDIIKRDRAIGVSLTGICNNPVDMRAGARAVVAANARAAKVLGIRAAAACTCVKPSGTASLLLGCSAGVHPDHSARYLRRIIVSGADKGIAAKLPAEIYDGVRVTFPCVGSGVTLDALDLADQYKMVKNVYKQWVAAGGSKCGVTRHNVSCTLVVDDDTDLVAFASKIWRDRDVLTALSFAPRGLEKRYANAPREDAASGAAADVWQRNAHALDVFDGVLDTDVVAQHALSPACAGGTCLI